MINNFKKFLIPLIIIFLIDQTSLVFAASDNVNVEQAVVSEAICNLNKVCEVWRNEDNQNCPTDCPSSGIVITPPPPSPVVVPLVAEVAPEVEEPIIEKPIEQPKPTIIEKIVEVLKPLIPEIFKQPVPEVVSIEVPAEVSEEFSVFEKKWELLPSEPVGEIDLIPLSKEVEMFVEKFPGLETVFKEIGISQITDIEKLKTVELVLPGLAESSGQSEVIPIAEMSLEAKQKFPTEVVFVRAGGESIDFNSTLSVNKNGELQQKISTISGKSLQLAVKEDQPVDSVIGYVNFEAKASLPITLNKIKNSFFSNFISSLIFINSAFAKDEREPIGVEETREFKYTDPDKDGIYTADIKAPTIEGEYEITTVMNYKDPKLGNRKIKLITVIDPEGYIYERKGKRETRIPGATVSIFKLNSETNEYELWPAKQYNQDNPQITDIRGTYAFLVPKGFYYLKVESPEYVVYAGKPFQVKAGSGVHINVELKSKFQWFNIANWEIILFIATIVFIFFGLYKKRKKIILNKNKALEVVDDREKNN